MKPGLLFLADLSDDDVSWILDHGEEQQVIANTVLVQEGRAVEALVFVLHGLVGVSLKALQGQQVATLGPGEFLGEMAFLEGQAASATVAAVENTLLLKVPFAAIREAIERRPDFGSRLYRAFAITAARRLRERERQYGQQLARGQEDKIERNEVALQLEAVLEQFKSALQDADKAAISEGGEIPDGHRQKIAVGFRMFIDRVSELIGDGSDLSDPLRDQLGARVQREVLPYLLLTKTAERLYSKPRGYAGDFLSIDWMYEDQAAGSGRLGPLLDRCFLDEKAAQAVRNRRGLLCREIKRHLQRNPDRTVHITTMACGPAREVFDVFEQLEDPTRLQATLIDIDAEALAQVRGDAESRGLSEHIRLFHANLIYLALGRQKIDLVDQDLIYSIGLIDYFNDKLVGKLVNYAHQVLRPGGELILGNFHPRNPDKALMDHVLDWRLLHRTEADLDRLYENSSFGKATTDIHFEDAGVNLFACCTK